MTDYERMDNLNNEVKDLIEKLLFEGFIDIRKGYEVIKADTVKDYITDFSNGDSSSIYIYHTVYEWHFEDGELHLNWEA